MRIDSEQSEQGLSRKGLESNDKNVFLLFFLLQGTKRFDR
jgi:hypothetical protein